MQNDAFWGVRNTNLAFPAENTSFLAYALAKDRRAGAEAPPSARMNLLYHLRSRCASRAARRSAKGKNSPWPATNAERVS
jgi:hypothetical protein